MTGRQPPVGVSMMNLKPALVITTVLVQYAVLFVYIILVSMWFYNRI
jgi:hypothetical protein